MVGRTRGKSSDEDTVGERTWERITQSCVSTVGAIQTVGDIRRSRFIGRPGNLGVRRFWNSRDERDLWSARVDHNCAEAEGWIAAARVCLPDG